MHEDTHAVVARAGEQILAAYLVEVVLPPDRAPLLVGDALST